MMHRRYMAERAVIKAALEWAESTRNMPPDGDHDAENHLLEMAQSLYNARAEERTICRHTRIVRVIGDPKSPTAHVCECGVTLKPLTLDEVKAALAKGAEERQAAERTSKRSPRR